MVALRSRLDLLWLFAVGLAGSSLACSNKHGAPGQKSSSGPQTQPDEGSTLVSSTAGPDGSAGELSPKRPPNVLLLIADDLGVDILKSSGITKKPADTPNLDRMAAVGVVVDNFWVTPACTTARRALISGLHGFGSESDHVPAVMPFETATI